MKRLALDTSTDRASIALEVDGIVYKAAQMGITQHARVLLDLIQNLLQQGDLTLAELDEIVFGCGPGSFTGLRVTCSVAKALAYAYNLPLCPVSSVQAIAAATNVAGYNLVLMDARMQEVYWALFLHGKLLTPIAVNKIDEIVLDVQAPLILSGVGFSEYLPNLNPTLHNQVQKIMEIYPDAACMFNCIENKVSALDAEPLYVRNKVTS